MIYPPTILGESMTEDNFEEFDLEDELFEDIEDLDLDEEDFEDLEDLIVDEDGLEDELA